MLSGMNCFESSVELIGLYPRVPDAVQRPLRCSAEPGPSQAPDLTMGPGSAAHHFVLRSIRGMSRALQLTGPKSVAGLHRALLVAGHEPLLSLRGGAVGERIRHHPSGGLPLQRVVADRGCRRQRRVDVTRFKEVRALLLLAVDPDARQAIRLQFDLHLQRVGFRLAADLLLQPRHARQDAEQVLDVMPGFMGDDVGCGELAGIARTAVKPSLDLTEKSGIEKNRLVRRAVERSHRRLRHAAAPAIGRVAKQHDFRTRIGLPAGLEDFAPAIVDLAEDAGDHAAHLVGRRTGLDRPGSAIGFISLAAAGQNFRAADQDAGIDAERIADQAKDDDGADAEAAAAHRNAKAATTAHSAAIIAATVFDVVAAAEIIVTHGGFSLIQPAASPFAETNAADT